MALKLALLSVLVAQGSALILHAKENRWCMDGHVAPSVFLLGFSKAGTSSLWADLKNRLDLQPAQQQFGDMGYADKEVSFFTDNGRYKRGKSFYLQHYPRCELAAQGARFMDASPNTIFESQPDGRFETRSNPTMSRIQDFYGKKSKHLGFVIITRDPADRMESAYWHYHPKTHGGFDQFVNDTIDDAYKKFHNEEEVKFDYPFLYRDSMFSEHMKPWVDEFGPSQFSFVTLQQYKRSPQKTLQFIGKRLNMKVHDEKGSVQKVNARKHVKMSLDTREKLSKFFAPWEKKLDDLVQEHGIGMPSTAAELLRTGKETPTQVTYMDEKTDAEMVLQYGENGH